MPALDWVFTGVLVLSTLLGVWRGFVSELISLAAWVAAFMLAQWWALDAAKFLPLAQMGESLRYAAGFAAVFVAVLFSAALLAFVLRKLLSMAGLGVLDRLLGALFGGFRGVVIVLAVTVVVGLTPLKNTQPWQSSAIAQVAQTVLTGLKPVLPTVFEKYLSS